MNNMKEVLAAAGAADCIVEYTYEIPRRMMEMHVGDDRRQFLQAVMRDVRRGTIRPVEERVNVEVIEDQLTGASKVRGRAVVMSEDQLSNLLHNVYQQGKRAVGGWSEPSWVFNPPVSLTSVSIRPNRQIRGHELTQAWYDEGAVAAAPQVVVQSLNPGAIWPVPDIGPADSANDTAAGMRRLMEAQSARLRQRMDRFLTPAPPRAPSVLWDAPVVVVRPEDVVRNNAAV